MECRRITHDFAKRKKDMQFLDNTLKTSPLLLTRFPQNNHFYLLWPERREFVLEDRESFVLLDEDRMYAEKWYEDPDYRDEVLMRDVKTCKVLEPMPGAFVLCRMVKNGS